MMATFKARLSVPASPAGSVLSWTAMLFTFFWRIVIAQGGYLISTGMNLTRFAFGLVRVNKTWSSEWATALESTSAGG